MTDYRIEKLGGMLRRGEAWIMGRSCTGAVWPEGDHNWIVYTVKGNVYHVPVWCRKTWGRYDTGRQK